MNHQVQKLFSSIHRYLMCDFCDMRYKSSKEVEDYFMRHPLFIGQTSRQISRVPDPSSEPKLKNCASKPTTWVILGTRCDD